MKHLTLGFFIILSLVLHLRETNAGAPGDEVYIVYMGAAVSSNGGPRNDRAHLLSSLTKRRKNSVMHTYSNGFSGFAARLSNEEAKSIAQMPGVVSVFHDPILQLHTTRSWDFLKYQNALKTDATPTSSSNGADVIIGILDTGIWPESKSFIDTDMGPIPSRWKGTCMEGGNFSSSNCNRKVIGARYYVGTSSDGTPRDDSGHGTHVASTAAGRPVSDASYYGLAKGTAAGGSPDSRIAMYRVCSAGGGCEGSAILKGFDDAIADGVDILSLSLGSSPREPAFSTDPISIGAFHAVEKGITVVCSAGNSGPDDETVVNVAPWILTVAATTIDRDFEADIILGGNKVIKGGGINFSGLSKSPIYALTDGNSAKLASASPSEASNCIPRSLDDNKVKGKIVLCENNDGEYRPIEKFNALKNAGVVGMIIIDNAMKQVASKYGASPIAVVTEGEAAEIQSYLNSTSNPLATILPTVTVTNHEPAPVVAYFSSRGPIPNIKNLIKPDIAAPGVAILAAWPSNDQREALPNKTLPLFNILSGTSMACPHVSALAANIKSQHPTWSPSAIRSAIMTTAIQTNNLRASITTNTGSVATPYDIGAGEISVSAPLQPGLVYETEANEYIQFLCSIGYDTKKIRSISSSLASNFSCPSDSNPDQISQMNYPSIAISNLGENETKTVRRTVTNVGEEDSAYEATVEAPSGVNVQVVPSKLQFSKNVKKLSFQIAFKLIKTSDDLFGSITWSSDKYQVRSPFIVSSA